MKKRIPVRRARFEEQNGDLAGVDETARENAPRRTAAHNNEIEIPVCHRGRSHWSGRDRMAGSAGPQVRR